MFKKDVFSQDDFEYCIGQFEDFLKMQYPKAKNINEQIKLFCHKFCFDDLYDIQKLDKLPRRTSNPVLILKERARLARLFHRGERLSKV